MSLIQVCVLSSFSFAICKALVFLLRRPHGIDLDGPNRGNWLTGNVSSLFEGGVDYCVHIAEKYGGAVRLHGPLGETVYVSDPRALYHMVVKDQHIFEEPSFFVMFNKLLFGEGLISTVGEQHRRQRKLLNPVFSTSNMRRLLSILHPISDRLTSTLVSKLPADGSHKEIDILPWISRCALDGVCQGILGYPSDTLSAAENDPYPEALRKIGPLIGKLMKFMADVREMRRTVETMDSASRKAFLEKKTAMEAKETPDPVDTACRDSDSMTSMMDIMLKANVVSSNTERLTDEELLGQMNVMVFAGLDTTTSVLARCIYLLAQHSGAQARLRSEIRNATKIIEEDGDMSSAELPYDVLMNLPFLDGVVKETLRLYPSLPLMMRVTSKATTLPLQFPTRSRSGGYTSTVAIPEGVHTIISILAANRHREMWGADANEWRPERWLSSSLTASSETQEANCPMDGEDATSTSRSAPVLGVKDSARFPGVYSNMMTFLGGSRSCIGFKFAEMELKQVIATLVMRLHFSLPTERNAQGYVKEIQWKLQAFHIPVVKPPAGDGVTPQVPLNVRLVKEDDFIW
ncbi:cytochrome P450 [Suillus subalutaceus]|uniref:cytochrome P450 n=1 Tax=Suillus subalutaceus TaxID=48586 RepID=UPI001B86F571|nr:cytochrome P450 [Suillus subalutaceus]KAG1854210.1 cytochrome P450 [Suillus subalutaceus]